MGSRGPISRRSRPVATRAGRVRRLPGDADAIFRRLARDLKNIEPGDVALVEDMARWASIAHHAYCDLALDKPVHERSQQQGLTVPDTTHGDGTEMRKNPLLIVLRTASEQLRADAQQLGATPLARARMPEEEPQQLSLADLLFAEVEQAVHDGTE